MLCRPALNPVRSNVNKRTALAILTAALIAVPGAQHTRVQSAEQPTQPGCTLRIHVDGFRNTRGNLGTILFTSPAGWPEDKTKSFSHGPAPIDEQTHTAIAIWTGLPPGSYAVAVIHDENSNAKLDRNFIGIPKEGFGFANNPHVALSAPPFQHALIRLACPATDITIHLQYK
jgi:uncharacterized protein (DUF2141 family)